jgi:hypothetical protein
MKINHYASLIFLYGITTVYALDPTTSFKTDLVIGAADKILKWQGDLNGDGKNDLFYSLKSDSEDAIKNLNPPSWFLYLSNAAGTDFLVSPELKEANGDVGGELLEIDPLMCFCGQITELGKKGIATMRRINPREGPTINIIYAYTIEEGYLKKTELARYVDSTTPHALFAKYLADNKRTVIVPVEITP